MVLLRSHAAVGYLISAILHAGLMAVFTWRAVPLGVQMVATTSVDTSLSDRPDEHSTGEQWSVEQTRDASNAELDAPASPPADTTGSANRTSVDSPPRAASPGLGEFARQRLERARDEIETKSSEEQLADLESLGRRLSQVSSEESVREVAGALSKWLGANERATQPTTAAQSSGTFDFGTAQISDVMEIETDSGMTYVAVLVDAQGNSRETPMDGTDGPQLFQTFQLMKRFPLLETVYRGAVMGLLDQLAQPPSRTVDSERQPQTESGSQQQ